ncbi:GrpB family protein [Priestia megaterium]|nr:GrpB family protein [Priestia megaterium]
MHKLREIHVVPYEKKWSDLFNQEAALLKDIFKDEIIAIHHIGSTSILELSAKPIIDILIEVKDIKRVDIYNQAMVHAGYEVKGENGIGGRRYFQKGGAKRTHHLHIYNQKHDEVIRHLNFRDYLRHHPDAAREYEQLKKQLAAQYRFEPQKYVDGKTLFIKEIDQKAFQWKENM